MPHTLDLNFGSDDSDSFTSSFHSGLGPSLGLAITSDEVDKWGRSIEGSEIDEACQVWPHNDALTSRHEHGHERISSVSSATSMIKEEDED